MIRNGFQNSLISVEDEFGGCDGLCCRIGSNAFYFTGEASSYWTAKEYWKSYTLDMTINILYNILKSVEAAEENGLDCMEYDYYESILNTV